jgi:hypothetical protein
MRIVGINYSFIRSQTSCHDKFVVVFISVALTEIAVVALKDALFASFGRSIRLQLKQLNVANIRNLQ